MAKKKSIDFDPLEELDEDIVDAVKEGIKEGAAKGAKEGSQKGFKEAAVEKYQELAKELAEKALSGKKNDPLDEQIQTIKKLNELKAMEATSKILSQGIESKSTPDSNNDLALLQTFLLTANEQEKGIASTFLSQNYKPKEIIGIITAMRQMNQGQSGQKSSSGFDIQDQLKTMLQMRVYEKMLNPETQTPAQPKPDSQTELLKLLIEKTLTKPEIPQSQGTDMITKMLELMQRNQEQIEQARKEAEESKIELLMNRVLPQLQPKSLSDELTQVQQTLNTLKTLGLINDGSAGRTLTEKEIELKSRQEQMLLNLKMEEMRIQRETQERQARQEEMAQLMNTLIPMASKFIELFKQPSPSQPRTNIEETRKIIQEKIMKKQQGEGTANES